MDASGNIYGTTAAGGGDGFGIIWELPASATNITRLASYDGTDGNQLGNGIARDPNGDIFVIAEAAETTARGLCSIFPREERRSFRSLPPLMPALTLSVAR